jgi:hypothetical protein
MRILEIATSVDEVPFSVAILALLIAGCDGSGPEALGVTASAQGAGYCITNVHTDIPTVHFRGQEWMIGSSEGLGPRDLEVNVTEFVQPQVSTSTSVKPSGDDISAAVGYSVTTRYQISASSKVAVTAGAFQRLEAYTAFQRAIWEIRDAVCNVHLGMGASYKPVGVYFETVNAGDFGIFDPGVYAPAPDCGGPGCVPAAPPPGADPPDAGAPDGG